MNETLKVKFTGNGISPDKVSASEFAGIITAYEKALLAVADRNHPGRKGISYVSVVNVKNESLTFEALPSHEDIVEAANEINTAIKFNRIQKLPIIAVDNLNVFLKFIEKHHCTAVLNGIDRIETAEITPKTELKVTESFFYRGETTVYGSIVRIGGAQPKVRIQTDSGKSISVVATKKAVKTLTNHLYERVGIKGIAKWRKEDDELVEIKLREFLPISTLPLSEKLAGLSSLLSKYWENIDNPDDYISDLRGDSL